MTERAQRDTARGDLREGEALHGAEQRAELHAIRPGEVLEEPIERPDRCPEGGLARRAEVALEASCIVAGRNDEHGLVFEGRAKPLRDLARSPRIGRPHDQPKSHSALPEALIVPTDPE